MFNRLAFYGEQVGFLVAMLWLAHGWPFAFPMILLLIICNNGVYLLRYVMLEAEKYAHIKATEEFKKTEADAAGIEDKRQSESENKVEYEEEEEEEEEKKPVQTDGDNETEELNNVPGDNEILIGKLEDQCHEHKKGKEDLTKIVFRLTNSLYNFSKDLTRLREENKDLVAKHSELNTWYEFQVQTTLHYQSRNTILEEENKVLQNNLKETKSSNDEVKSSFEFYKYCYGAIEKDHMRLMEEKIELSATLTEKTKHFQKSLQELQDKCRILEEENYELHEKCGRLENHTETSDDADDAIVKEMEEKCKRLEEENAELMTELAAAKMQLMSEISDEDDADEDDDDDDDDEDDDDDGEDDDDDDDADEIVKELEEKCRRLWDEKVELFVTFTEKADHFHKSLQELQDKCRILEEDNSELRVKCSRLENDDDNDDEEEEEEEEEEDEDDAIVKELEEKCRRLEVEKIELSATFTQKEDHFQKSLQELQDKCRILEDDNNELHVKCSMLENDTETSDDDEEEGDDDYDAIVNELEERCRRMEEENSELTKELSAAKASAALYQSFLHDLDSDDDLVFV